MRGLDVRGVLLALTACNQVFGLDKTRPVIFDGRPDAPFRCPDAGHLPALSVYFKQVVVTDSCQSYTASLTGNVAVAMCEQMQGDLSIDVVEQGTLEASTLAATTLSSPVAAPPMLSPAGDELWTASYDTNTNMSTVTVYAPDGANAWSRSYDAYTVAYPVTIGTPMRAGASRRVVAMRPGGVDEMEETAPHTWTLRHTYAARDFGISQFSSTASLGGDGLRMVFVGALNDLAQTTGVMYVDRPTLDDMFGQAQLLPGPPPDAETPYLTEDCSRLYFSGLGSVLYVPQQ